MWLRQVFNAVIHLEYVPTCILTGIICPIYKGKGKDPFNCHTYRGITENLQIPAVGMNPTHSPEKWTSFPCKHSLSESPILPRCHLYNTRSNSEAVCNGGDLETFLCLYNFWKGVWLCGTVCPPQYNAGINGKACRVISHTYNSNIHVVVRSGSSYSSPYSISRGIHQGSVFSSTLFLVELLQSMNEGKIGIFICNLYLGGADDVRASVN